MGGVFGVSKYILLISILLVFVDQFSFMFEFFESNFLDESVMFESLKITAELIEQSFSAAQDSSLRRSETDHHKCSFGQHWANMFFEFLVLK